jgi:4-amino-4-deoxy-L-arabinose transferase-like glycosyltransferase
MKSITQKETLPLSQDELRSEIWRSRLRPWLTSWEIYLIILLASFLRLYQLYTTEFDADQANIFRMAYDAIHHGMLIATSNQSSLGTINPPAIVYLLTPPALFSSNPLWAAVWVAFLSIIAILLTYIFTRRYFGRLAGSFAALLFTTSTLSVEYSRFIWNQNLLLLFVPLFIMTLLWGLVERRKGWLVPALFLLGLMYQLHGSSLLLISALVVVVVLAPGTIRWRDLPLAVLALLILYAPYLLWEVQTNFSDVTILLSASKQPQLIDNQALLFYQMFLNAYSPVGVPQSSVYPFLPLIEVVNAVMTPLLFIAGGMALVQIIGPRRQRSEPSAVSSRLLARLYDWWRNLRSDTYRCSLLVLLAWQAVPLVALLRHSITLYPHYFIFFMPGQYILIALLLVRCIEWFRKFRGWGQVGYFATYLLAIVLISVQFLASTGQVIDLAVGNFNDGPHLGYRSDLLSLRHAFVEADQLAQRHHLKHLYISMYANYIYLQNATYLAAHTITPATVFNDKCMVLPDPSSGPAVLLVGPYNPLATTLLAHFASVTLVDKPEHLGGSPFHLYIVNSSALPDTAQASFPQQMNLLSTQRFNFQNAPWVVTQWKVLHALPRESQTVYNYNILDLPSGADPANADRNRQCFLTSMWSGDQLLVAFPVQSGGQALTSLDIQIQSATIAPRVLYLHLFRSWGISFETGSITFPPATVFNASDGQDHIRIPIPNQGAGG